MKLKLIEYSEEIDQKLLNLFYQSIFYKKKEFEYVRVPNNWIYRYKMADNYVIKIVEFNRDIIASLGALIRFGKVDGDIVKIGCFIDNCILPKYFNKYNEIFKILFKEVENELKDRNVKILCGWEFLNNFKNHIDLFKTLGFKWVEGINWFSSAIPSSGKYPFLWKTKINIFWKLFFKLFSYYNKIKSELIETLPDDIVLRYMRQSDIKNVCETINQLSTNIEFASFYYYHEFKKIIKNNNIHGIIAEKDSEIVGVMTFVTSAWSGWMFGKPFYNNNWQIFYGFTPDEFLISDNYKNSTIPSHMLKLLMNLDSTNYNFVANVFDRRLEWRKKACLNLGFVEPKFDRGVILAKTLAENININPNKCWHLPARCIIAPVPLTKNIFKI